MSTPLSTATRYLEQHTYAATDDEPRSRLYALAICAYETGADMSGFGRLIVTWVTKASDLNAFVVEFDRMPRENNRLKAGAISVRERSLHEFVRYQRRAATKNAHSSLETEILMAIPGWRWHPHDDAWASRLDEYKEFLKAAGRAPRSKSTDREERQLAAWAATQRHLHRKGSLSDGRSEKLELLSIWAW